MDDDNIRLIRDMLKRYGTAGDRVKKEEIDEMIQRVIGYPTSLVERVVDKFLTGTVPGQSLDFPPSCTRFAHTLQSEPFIGAEEQAFALTRIRAESATEPRLPSPEPKQEYPNLGAELKQLAASIKTPPEQE